MGPPGHPFFGHFLLFRKDPLGFLIQCARGGFGEIVPLRLLGQPAFLLLHPADIERVLVTEHRGFVKPRWLRSAAVRRLLGDGLVTSDGPEWRHQRQTCQPAFHLGLMQNYGDSITALTDKMLAAWLPGQAREVQRDMTQLTLQIVARTLFGVDADGWTAEAGAAMDALMARFTAERSFFGLIPLPPAPEEVRATRQLDGVIDFLISRHSAAEEEKSGDLISFLQRPAIPGEPGLTGRPLREQIKTFLAAGHESSALALTWACILLAQHPEAAARLSQELATILEHGAPTLADASRLPYTEAVLKETMRLYPPLWMTGRRAVQRCEIGGLTVPAGALVLTSQWAVQRDPRHFPDPDEFKPERWLNGGTANLPRFAYFPFGGGPRVCIGQSFAMMEMTLILAAVSQRFRLELVPGQTITPKATMTLRPPSGLLTRIREQDGYTHESSNFQEQDNTHGL